MWLVAACGLFVHWFNQRESSELNMDVMVSLPAEHLLFRASEARLFLQVQTLQIMRKAKTVGDLES